jgi:inhibitor of KinA
MIKSTSELDYKLVINGDTGITILFNQPMSEALSRRIVGLAKICDKQFPEQLTQVIPAYQSLTLCYLPNKISYQSLISQLELLLEEPDSSDNTVSQKIVIPVCYAKEFAPDLQSLSQITKLSEQEIIRKHTDGEYLVHMLGFSPGFLYLGGLSAALTCPRKATPDLRVPAGSVGIGGAQTGIYPQNSPGGWQIIGRTPISLFDVEQQQTCIAQPLDTVIFEEISVTQFHHLSVISRDSTGQT